MHYFLLIYFNSKPLYVSSRLAAHHQEDQPCISSNCVVMLYVDWLLLLPVNITHYYTSCCLYRVDPPDNEQQACSKHAGAYLLTPWCRVLLEKLTGLQLVKYFPAFHGTRRFITALTSVRQLSLSWVNPIQSIYPHPTSWRSIIILSTHLRIYASMQRLTIEIN